MRANIRTYAKTLAGQTDTGGVQQVSATQINSIIDEVCEWAWNFYGPRYDLVQYQTPSGHADATSYGFDPCLQVDSSNTYRLTTGNTALITSPPANIPGGQSYAEIIAVIYEAGTVGVLGAQVLERVEYHELLRLKEKFGVTLGTPAFVHYHRIQGTNQVEDGSTANLYTDGKWLIMFQPLVGIGGVSKNFSLIVRYDRRRLRDDADVPDLLQHECCMVARITAYIIASMSGRSPDYLDMVASLIPEEVKASRGIKMYAGQGVTPIDTQGKEWQ